MKIFISGLPQDIAETDLKVMFAEYGKVTTVNIVREGATGLSQGFGFAEMPVKEEAERAITNMAGREIEDKTLTVEKARGFVRQGGRSRSNSTANRRDR